MMMILQHHKREKKMGDQELREKLAAIVYITRDTDKGIIAVLTPEEYIEMEDKLIKLLNQNKDE
jgi:hypothetical protein